MTSQNEFGRRPRRRKLRESCSPGPCDFIWGATSIDNLPPAHSAGGRVRRTLQRRQIEPRQRAHRPQDACARVATRRGARGRSISSILAASSCWPTCPAMAMRAHRRRLADEWQTLIFAYLRGRANLRRVVLLVDARRGAMDTDRRRWGCSTRRRCRMCWRSPRSISFPQRSAQRRRSKCWTSDADHTAAYPEAFATSALKNLGLDALKAHIVALAAN